MELEGFKECLAQLDNDVYTVNTVATDRNKQLAKRLREQRPSMKHQYDPWHFAKLTAGLGEKHNEYKGVGGKGNLWE